MNTREYNAAYYRANAERIKRRVAAYRRANPDKSKRWAAAAAEKMEACIEYFEKAEGN